MGCVKQHDNHLDRTGVVAEKYSCKTTDEGEMIFATSLAITDEKDKSYQEEESQIATDKYVSYVTLLSTHECRAMNIDSCVTLPHIALAKMAGRPH